MIIIKGDLLEAKEEYIAQQCNCLTVRSHGLSSAIAKKWTWADPYSGRKRVGTRNLAIEADRDKPGTIKVLSSQDRNKHVICIFGQWVPGIPRKYQTYPDWEIDSFKTREKWFKMSLSEIAQLDIKTVAFPYNIGCGLAGGDWKHYSKMLEDWEEESGIKVVLYKL